MDRSLNISLEATRSQVVRIAPSALKLNSQYTPVFEEKEEALEETLSELEIEKHHRDKVFNNRLAEIWEHAGVVEARIKEEAVEAETSITQMQTLYADRITALSAAFTHEIHSIFDKFDAVDVPRSAEQAEAISKHMDEFFGETVPAAISRQSGQVERDLKRTYDFFEIDKQKTAKREALLLEAANHHIAATQQRFHDERALMSSVMFVLEEDIVADERREAMLAAPRYTNAVRNVLVQRAAVEMEAQQRGAEDAELLDAIVETQSLLQKTILEHFGREEGDAPQSFPALERLNSRRLSRPEVNNGNSVHA